MKKRTAVRLGAVIIAVAAAAFALTGSAGGNMIPVADQIAYMSTLDGEADIYTMTPTGFLNFNLTHDKTLGLRADVEPAWSPDGEFVAFQRNFVAKSGVQSSQIFLVAADGTKLGPLMPPMKGVVDMHPTWAPDGQSIVFASDRGGNFELYLYTLNSGQVIQLTHTKLGVENLEPAWSPDGEMIVFTRQRATVTVSAASLYVLMVEKGTAYPLTKGGLMGRGDHDATWSPDSTRVAFTSDRLGSSTIRSNDLWVVNVNGTGLTRVTTLAGNEYHPTFSPYGDQLAFIGDQTGATEVYSFTLPTPNSAIPPPPSKIRQITVDGAYKSNPTWHGPGIGLPPTN